MGVVVILGDHLRRYDYTFDAGLDTKLGITSRFTLVLTLNTDFAKVEPEPEAEHQRLLSG